MRRVSIFLHHVENLLWGPSLSGILPEHGVICNGKSLGFLRNPLGVKDVFPPRLDVGHYEGAPQDLGRAGCAQ